MWCAIVLAGGSGSRMKAGMNKVLLSVGGEAVITRSVRAVQPFADRVVVVCTPDDRAAIQTLLQPLEGSDRILYANGGATRQDSVLGGLQALPEDCTHVLIHDGARCLVDSGTIQRAMECAAIHGSGIAAVAAVDTIKRVNADGSVAETPDRAALRAVQTPQAFERGVIESAHRQASADGYIGTDDASLLEHMGVPVYLSEGDRKNIKLTTQEDMIMAEALLGNSPLPVLRIGQGYDVHRLVEGRDLILCGVHVPHTLGLLGHSDADVALHALMDAMLGAAALGDIGKHFPDTGDKYRGISSLLLLEHVVRLLKSRNLTVSNCDVTIVAQKPKLLPYIPLMRENIANTLGIDPDCVNVKATTTEKLGFEGEQQGISAQAVCMLRKA